MVSRWSLLLMASCLSLNALADDYTCPESLEVRQTLVTSPTGWTGMYENDEGVTVLESGKDVTDKIKLVDISLYTGDPKEGNTISPDNEEALAEKEADSIWTLASADEQQKMPVYVGCHYEDSPISVFMKTTAPMKSCTWGFNADTVNNTLKCTPY
jgi:hypothetical protein